MDLNFPIIISVWAAWFGSIYLSLFISRLTLFKDLGEDYIGLIELGDTRYLRNSIGKDRAKKLKLLNSIFSFSIFFLLAAIFLTHTKYYEAYQIKNYGIQKKVVVEKITYKNGRRIDFEFEYNKKKFNKSLHSKDYKVNDTALIVFSSFNPNIAVLY